MEMMNSGEILKKIEDNREKIRKFGVKKIGLFGSYARGEQKTGSDIDILVEFEKGKKTFDNYMGLKFFLENLFGCKVDLVILESIKPELKPHILGSVKYASGI
ncbi:MAG TPA: nucleotidyltransferase [candidate division Zixibacteria bacterium]|nr:nucleotidyltransferase [candidate division Zixibacteria bacterium]